MLLREIRWISGKTNSTYPLQQIKYISEVIYATQKSQKLENSWHIIMFSMVMTSGATVCMPTVYVVGSLPNPSPNQSQCLMLVHPQPLFWHFHTMSINKAKLSVKGMLYSTCHVPGRYGFSCSALKGPYTATLRLQRVRSNWLRNSSIHSGAVWHQEQVWFNVQT